MNRSVLTAAVTLAFAVTGALIPTPALADSNSDGTPSWLTSQQRAALTQVGPAIDVSDAKKASDASTAKAKAKCKTKSMADKLYRGSIFMWVEDSFAFHYSSCKKKVTSSSLSQRAGYIFPNIAKAKGTRKYYSSAAKHKWHGFYSIGAGMVTPWGDVSVYSIDVTSDWQGEVRNIGGQMLGHLIGEWD